MTVMRAFIDANVGASRRTARTLRLPTDKVLWSRFEREVQDRIRALPNGATVVDVGGGRRCVYHHALRPGIKLIAVDISADELVLNPHADQKIVADISKGLPISDGSADLIVSRAVFEHVSDVPAAARNVNRALRSGGVTMHLLSCRYSLFGIAARVLPFEPLRRILHKVMPSTVDQVAFDVVYDQGTPSAMQRVWEEAGSRHVEVESTWAQPGYFEALYPVFLLYALYEVVVRALRLRTLAAYMVVRATR